MGDLVHPIEHGCRLGDTASFGDEFRRKLFFSVNRSGDNTSRNQLFDGCHIAVDLRSGRRVEKFARYVDYVRDLTEDCILVKEDDIVTIDTLLDLKSLIDERVKKPQI